MKLKKKMDRKDVYTALDTEREYQEKMTINSDRPDMISEFNTSTALLAMDVTLERAKSAWYNDNPDDSYQDTMEHLRKIAGMIVQMGEKYGIPNREL